MTLKEIVRPPYIDSRQKGENCPECLINRNVKLPLSWQLIRCPDAQSNIRYSVYSGCLVAHYGWHCNNCKKDYQDVEPEVEWVKDR